MAIKKYIYLTPLAILILAVGYSCYIVYTTDIVFGNKHYLGFVFLFFSVMGAFIRKDIGIYLTGITLLIGALNFIAFIPVIESYSFGFGVNGSGMDLKIQSFSFLLLLVYLVLNVKFLINQIRRNRVNDRSTQ